VIECLAVKVLKLEKIGIGARKLKSKQKNLKELRITAEGPCLSKEDSFTS